MSSAQKAEPASPPACCPSCVEWEIGLRQLFSPQEAARIATASVRRQIAQGAELLPQSHLHENCVALLRGIVKVSRLLADGRQQIVALKAAPDLLVPPFSTMGDLSIRAVTSAEILCVPRQVLEAITSRNHALEHRLHRRALEDLNRAEALLLMLGRKTARERIATFLLDIAGRLQVGDPMARCSRRDDEVDPVLDLPLTRAEIGDFLGLTLETVSRQFAALRRDGLIAFSDARRVEVKDRARLRVAAGF